MHHNKFSGHGASNARPGVAYPATLPNLLRRNVAQWDLHATVTRRMLCSQAIEGERQ